MTGKLTFLALFIAVVMGCYLLIDYTHQDEKHVEVTGGMPGEKYYSMSCPECEGGVASFDLVDPESAPEAELSQILYGYHVMLDTRKYVPEYCHNNLDCNSCHFNAGNTLGGKKRGISLVGVTYMYPRFSKRDNKEIDLAFRVDNCFMRSMNGKPLPHDSYEMKAILAYLNWISHELDDVPALPWLGLPPINSTHIPDPENGKKVYVMHCRICHGDNGEGSPGVPPIWGPDSYNDGAGMNNLSMISSFVLLNMPYGQPILTPEEALDVSSYVIKQPRPHFKK